MTTTMYRICLGAEECEFTTVILDLQNHLARAVRDTDLAVATLRREIEEGARIMAWFQLQNHYMTNFKKLDWPTSTGLFKSCFDKIADITCLCRLYKDAAGCQYVG
jgi:hypothetical protein